MLKSILGGIVLFVVCAAIAVTGHQIYTQYEKQKAASVRPRLDVPSNLVALHKQALAGTLQLTSPKELGMALIDAKFPPERPHMNLMPRARLIGTALVRVNEFLLTDSLYQYESDTNRRFSIFMVPKNSDFDPTTMPDMTMINWRLKSANVDGYNVILWRSGNWYVAFVTDLGGQAMAGLLEHILRTEWKFH